MSTPPRNTSLLRTFRHFYSELLVREEAQQLRGAFRMAVWHGKQETALKRKRRPEVKSPAAPDAVPKAGLEPARLLTDIGF